MTPLKSYQPRVALIGYNSGKWSSQEHAHNIPTDTGVEAWVHAFNGDYIHYARATPADIQKYDIIIANTDFVVINWLPKLIELSQARPASAKWVCLMEGSGGDYIKPHPHVRAALDTADLVNCINEYALPLIRRLTKTRTEYIGLPYPVDGVGQYVVPIEKRERETFICPLLYKRWTDYLVAKEIGLPYYGYVTHITRKPKLFLENLRRHGSLSPHKYLNAVKRIYNDSALDIRREVGLNESFGLNNAAALWINLDDRYTWGRYVLDAAALQIPIISTRSTGHAPHLFPHTTLADEFQLDEAVAIGKRLVQDADFYKEVAAYPVGKMEQLKAEPMKKKLLTALGMTAE